MFFDALGLTWDYEPEGYSLPSGGYLPDFWLPWQNAWFEVKGQWGGYDGREQALAGELAEATGRTVFIAYGPLPRTLDPQGHDWSTNIGDSIQYRASKETGDILYAFCTCPWCGRIGIEYDARGARVCGWRAHHDDYDTALARVVAQGHHRADDKCYTGDDPRIVKAYAAARSARFEHGESGAVQPAQSPQSSVGSWFGGATSLGPCPWCDAQAYYWSKKGLYLHKNGKRCPHRGPS